MKITELFNVSSVADITVEIFLDFKKNGRIPDMAMVDYLGTRSDSDSYGYYGETSVIEHFANIIAEQHSRKEPLLGKDRKEFYDETINKLLREEDITSPVHQAELAPVGY